VGLGSKAGALEKRKKYKDRRRANAHTEPKFDCLNPMLAGFSRGGERQSTCTCHLSFERTIRFGPRRLNAQTKVLPLI